MTKAFNKRGVKIVQDILNQIKLGQLKLGEKLPSQSQLMSRYNVSVTTVRSALNQLQQTGIIQTEQGRGSFVSLQSTNRTEVSNRLNIGLLFERIGNAQENIAESEIILAFSNECFKRGHRLVLTNIDFQECTGGYELIESFNGLRLDGLCVFFHEPVGSAERLEQLTRHFPASVVFFPGRCYEIINSDSVEFDSSAGVRQLLKYMISLGHKRIAYAGPHVSKFLAGDEIITGGKLQTYRQVHKESGIAFDPSLCIETTYGSLTSDDRENIINAIKNKHITAVFAANDWLAREIMSWLWEEGIKVPEDISIAGIDNAGFSKMLIPPLTTVASPFGTVAETAMNLIEKRLEHKSNTFEKNIIPKELIIRRTTALPRQ
jgi:DNA-binding LacI/PurR family transcriptional regulator/predicted transcriptional regulator